VPPATDGGAAALDALREEVERCSSCPLGATRTRAVFGEGDAGADLMFVGEAPGYHEDQQGRPFVGQAGKLLQELLASIGMTREQVFIANVLKSRPPNNRDPRPEEIDACRPYLFRQIEIIRPRVICTLGNFATKLLTGDQTGITRVHGQPRATEIAGHSLYLYPIFHPAAALYTPAMRTTLEEDFSRLPRLLAHAAPQPGEAAAEPPAAERPAWQPPEHLRRCEGHEPASAAAPAAPAPPSAPVASAPSPAVTPGQDPPTAPTERPPVEPEQLGLF
jgi:DNA polymerase